MVDRFFQCIQIGKSRPSLADRFLIRNVQRNERIEIRFGQSEQFHLTPLF